MASETPLLPLQLPIIDFSSKDLKPGEPQWDLTRSAVKKALQDYGCFEAHFARIPIELRKSIFRDVEEAFELPLQTKLRNVSKKPYYGYSGLYQKVPMYESIGIDDSDIKEKVESITEDLWPQGNKSFSTKMHSYSKILSELDFTIRRMIMESFGLEKYIDGHLDSTNYLLRINKYNEQKPEKAIGSHTDNSIITILYQNHVDGLEVQIKDKSWIKVKQTQDSFIVMVGACLHAFLNGRLYPPYHHVAMKGTETRYSLALFSFPKEGHTISSPEELVDEEHPRLFKSFDHLEYLKFCMTVQKLSQASLKTYCGV